jgi:hypothetical protein
LPIHFVCRHPERWPELFVETGSTLPSPDEVQHRLVSGEDCWIVHVYLRLHAAGADVRLADRLVAGEICVVDGYELTLRGRPYASFLVCCRGDAPDPIIANWAILQNEVQQSACPSTFIPILPQPGLIPRDPGRGTRLARVAFKGDRINLLPELQSPDFRAALAEIGITLTIEDRDSRQHRGWHDYAATDAVLAVRNLTRRDALQKPASKLVNAWRAGAPALLGPEPAFRALRRSPLDYLEVATARDALAALRELRERPDLYQAMVRNGLGRAPEYSADNVVTRWLVAFDGPIRAAYQDWRREPEYRHMLRYLVRGVCFKFVRGHAKWARTHGPRIICAAP